MEALIWGVASRWIGDIEKNAYSALVLAEAGTARTNGTLHVDCGGGDCRVLVARS